MYEIIKDIRLAKYITYPIYSYEEELYKIKK